MPFSLVQRLPFQRCTRLRCWLATNQNRLHLHCFIPIKHELCNIILITYSPSNVFKLTCTKRQEFGIETFTLGFYFSDIRSSINLEKPVAPIVYQTSTWSISTDRNRFTKLSIHQNLVFLYYSFCSGRPFLFPPHWFHDHPSTFVTLTTCALGIIVVDIFQGYRHVLNPFIFFIHTIENELHHRIIESSMQRWGDWGHTNDCQKFSKWRP